MGMVRMEALVELHSYHWGIPAHNSSNIIFMFLLQQTAVRSLEDIRKSFPNHNKLLLSTSSSNFSIISLCTWLRTHQYGFRLRSLDFLVFHISCTFSVPRGCFESPILYHIIWSSKLSFHLMLCFSPFFSSNQSPFPSGKAGKSILMHTYYSQPNCVFHNQIVVHKRYGLQRVLIWFLFACEAEMKKRHFSSVFVRPRYWQK